MTTLAYFARPIDVDAGLTTELIAIHEAMNEAGWMVYDPGEAVSCPADCEPDPRIQALNYAWLDQCDVVVAVLPNTRSVGVPLEIDRADRAGKLVLAWADPLSWALARVDCNIRQFKHLNHLVDAIRSIEKYEPPSVEPALSIKVAGHGSLPMRGYPDDAGFDLFVDEPDGSVVIEPGDIQNIPCGVAVELPPGYWGFLVGRSSAFIRGLIVNPGIIDPGYRGGLFAYVRNVTGESIRIRSGERVAQLIPIPVFPTGVLVERVESLSSSARGTNGFGSTGG